MIWTFNDAVIDPADRPDLTAAEANDLAEIIKIIRMKYDNLYGFPMPLMMIFGSTCSTSLRTSGL